jgi:NAD(P)-dependent dehydrogenase (short-subunit alcohol dehydrogenase family)
VTFYIINLIIAAGASGIGELLANTLAVRNVTVVVLDTNPIVTENCTRGYRNRPIRETHGFADNITYFKCDVSNFEEVETVSRRIVEEVCT